MNSNVEGKKAGGGEVDCISSQYLYLGVTLFKKRMFKKLALATTVSLLSQVVSAVMLTKYSTACVLWLHSPEAHCTLDHMTILKMVHPKMKIRSSLSDMQKHKRSNYKMPWGSVFYLAIQRMNCKRKCIREKHITNHKFHKHAVMHFKMTKKKLNNRNQNSYSK